MFHHGQKILQELGIETVAEAVEYFSNFDNFADTHVEITLWEWSVITSVLQREGQLSTEGTVEIGWEDSLDHSFESESALGLSRRTARCLSRSDTATVQKFMALFAEGVNSARQQLLKVRNFGHGLLSELMNCMKKWQIVMPPELCYPDEKSTIVALDWSKRAYKLLNDSDHYEIKTIGGLMAVCSDTNRFSGLRYVDPKLYGLAVERLQRYGFMK